MATNGTTKTYGVTRFISDAGPTKDEVKVTEALIAELRARHVFESTADARAREIVLGRLNTLVKDFVVKVSMRLGMSELNAKDAGGKIFTFGSYRLGVSGPNADIDTLCVVPRHVSRDDFFETFHEILSQCPEVTDLTSVREAFVPILKFKFSGIEVDLLFARLSLSTIPDSLDLRDDVLLRSIDDACIRSVNGSRVTDEILRLVPNVQVFRDSLRAIKTWGKVRQVYSNVMGFFGGVSWALCVARVCQLYPNKPAGTIVNRFFSVLGAWTWPSPVLLKPIGNGPPGDTRRIWNPKIYPQDRGHRMPIITPAYPCMCSTHNVTRSTQQIIVAEFKRGLTVTDDILNGKKPWSALFEPQDFFSQYRYFLQVTTSSHLQDVQNRWSGTVESRLRWLVGKVEDTESIDVAHPCVKTFDRVSYYLNEDELRSIQTGVAPPEVPERTAAEVEGKEGAGLVYTTTFYVGLGLKPKPPGQAGPMKLDITYPVNDFTRFAKTWDGWDEQMMGIVVRYIKTSALPDYVFDGKPRPSATAATSKGIKRTKAGKAKNSPTPTSGVSTPMATDPSTAATTLSTTPTPMTSSGLVRQRSEDGEPRRPDALKRRRPSSFIQETAATSSAVAHPDPTLPGLEPPPPAADGAAVQA